MSNETIGPADMYICPKCGRDWQRHAYDNDPFLCGYPCDTELRSITWQELAARQEKTILHQAQLICELHRDHPYHKPGEKPEWIPVEAELHPPHGVAVPVLVLNEGALHLATACFISRYQADDPMQDAQSWHEGGPQSLDQGWYLAEECFPCSAETVCDPCPYPVMYWLRIPKFPNIDGAVKPS